MISSSPSPALPPVVSSTDNEGSPRWHVLLIEDDPLHRQICKAMLEGASPAHHITMAQTVAECVAMLPVMPTPDIVLLDLALPDGKGADLLPSLIEQWPDSAMVVITGHDDMVEAHRLIGLGADDYLVKGEFNQKWLLRSLNYAIKRRAFQRHSRYWQSQIEAQNQLVLCYHQQFSTLAQALESSIQHHALGASDRFMCLTTVEMAQATLDMIQLAMGHYPLNKEPAALKELIWEALIGALGYEDALLWEQAQPRQQQDPPALPLDRALCLRAFRFAIQAMARQGTSCPVIEIKREPHQISLMFASDPARAEQASQWRLISPSSTHSLPFADLNLHLAYASAVARLHGAELAIEQSDRHNPMIRWEWASELSE